MQSLGILLTFQVGLLKLPRGKEEGKRNDQRNRFENMYTWGTVLSHVGIHTVHTDIVVLPALVSG